MSNRLVNRARMTVSAAPGTGAAPLGSAVGGFLAFAAAGVVDGDVVSYLIEDGSAWEIGSGIYTASGTSLSRSPVAGSSGASPINASVSAIVSVTALAGDLASLQPGIVTLTDAATVTWPANTPLGLVTLGGNRTLALPTRLQAGSYALLVKQDATGGRTLAYATGFKWPGGAAPTLSTAANAVDLLSFISDGTSLYGAAQKAYA